MHQAFNRLQCSQICSNVGHSASLQLHYRFLKHIHCYSRPVHQLPSVPVISLPHLDTPSCPVTRVMVTWSHMCRWWPWPAKTESKIAKVELHNRWPFRLLCFSNFLHVFPYTNPFLSSPSHMTFPAHPLTRFHSPSSLALLHSILPRSSCVGCSMPLLSSLLPWTPSPVPACLPVRLFGLWIHACSLLKPSICPGVWYTSSGVDRQLSFKPEWAALTRSSS